MQNLRPIKKIQFIYNNIINSKNTQDKFRDCSLVILVCQFHFRGVANQTKANKTSICHSHDDVFLLLHHRPEFISFSNNISPSLH